ncbi:MAG: hypothetical protein QOE86_1829, partial [Solirubrobacteraceae bacterium]|nr:hypothetical protein [Solirubrobacteraceae bacterium]
MRQVVSPLLAVAALAAAAFGIAFALSGSDASVGRATPAEQPHAFTVSAKAPRLARLAALATPPRLAREPKRRPAATTTPSSTTTTATVTATA